MSGKIEDSAMARESIREELDATTMRRGLRRPRMYL